uniref:Putative oxidation resistance protein 1 n=1 Tax=Davidia involucrata TaxID=16924 RepID=A0A5B6Z522_DAVIN
MYSWKDRVTEKLSRLFSDSASSTSSSLNQPLARPYTKDGNSSSSIFSFTIPSASLDGFRSNKHQHDIKPIQSLPVRWNSRCLSLQDKPLDSYAKCDPKCENRETPNSHEEYREHGSGRSTECKSKGELNAYEEYGELGSGRSTSGRSDMFEDAADPHNMEKSMPCLTEDSSFISPNLYEFLQSSIPNIVKGCQWVLLYRAVRSNMVYHFVHLFVKVLVFLVLVC